MRQTTLCVPLEVKPESCARLTALIAALNRREDESGGPAGLNYHRVFTMVPALHFMSMSVFPGHAFDPIFILEANFDGPPGVFWGQVEALLGDDLRAIVRCCKRPLDGKNALYDAVTLGNAAPCVAYLEAQTQGPSVFHHGNRGLTRDQILEGHKLFLAVRDAVDAMPETDPAVAHRQLRAQLAGRFPVLGTPAPPRLSGGERAMDWARLLWFVVQVLLVLSLPGILLAQVMPLKAYLVVVAGLAAWTIWLVWNNRHALTGTEVTTRVKVQLLAPDRLVLLALGVATYIAAAALIVAPGAFFVARAIGAAAHLENVSYGQVLQVTGQAVGLGLLSLLATVPGMVLILRYNELRDSSHDQPTPDPALLHEIVRREDWIMQNHMGSIVHIKPGILRTIVIRAGHFGLGLYLRVSAANGYLGSMRTVHFAHWAFLNNTSRLVFLSNFDHSWDSYLDDFIEKSHAGLTLAWGCGVGFPPARLLLFDGATHGRQFKAWALASRTASRFWYSAYPELTVDQVEREYRIATGLRKPSLTPEEAATWAWDL